MISAVFAIFPMPIIIRNIFTGKIFIFETSEISISWMVRSKRHSLPAQHSHQVEENSEWFIKRNLCKSFVCYNPFLHFNLTNQFLYYSNVFEYRAIYNHFVIMIRLAFLIFKKAYILLLGQNNILKWFKLHFEFGKINIYFVTRTAQHKRPVT